MKINNISIVIPILNEEKNLTKLIKEIKKVKKKMSVNKFELILVDDDSTDGTHEILINLKKEIISLDILSEKKEEIYHNHVFMVLIKLNMRI